MGHDLSETYPEARRTFAEADDCLGTSLSRLCFDGPADRLALTENAQPAILAASVASYRVLQARTGMTPLAVAGHSLGEWSALVATGALSLSDAVRSVRERGRLMQSAVPVGEGAMAALLGIDAEAAAALCADAAQGQVLTPANLNGGGQVVIAGQTAAVDRAVALAGQRRIRAQRLAVSAPFHCPLMAPAAAGLRRVLAGVVFHDPVIPVVSSVDGEPRTRGSDLGTLLVEQVTAPVQWEAAARRLADWQPTLALEVGPGRALTGLMKRILPALPTQPAGDVEGVARVVEAFA
jgi:[acyl-carrier-protein] S-malonyltransferase